eukprot:9899390-Alexandrium_andersonii.AAC.1
MRASEVLRSRDGLRWIAGAKAPRRALHVAHLRRSAITWWWQQCCGGSGRFTGSGLTARLREQPAGLHRGARGLDVA